MTSKEVFTYVLMELNKNNAPSIDLETFNYFFNKTINQFINKQYNFGVDTDQQRTDNLRVLKTSAVLTPIKTPSDLSQIVTSKLLKGNGENGIKGDAEVINLDSIYGATYEFALPADYLHLLNCICIYKVLRRINCPYNVGNIVMKGATKVTADAWPLIIDNLYMRPSYKRPYYYINNLNTSNQNPTNPVNESSFYSKETIPFEGTDYAHTDAKTESSDGTIMTYTDGVITPIKKGSLSLPLEDAFSLGLEVTSTDGNLSSTSYNLTRKIKNIKFQGKIDGSEKFAGINLGSNELQVSTCPLEGQQYTGTPSGEVCSEYSTNSRPILQFNDTEVTSISIPIKSNNVIQGYQKLTDFSLTTVTKDNLSHSGGKFVIPENSLLGKVLKYNKETTTVSINNSDDYQEFIKLEQTLQNAASGAFNFKEPTLSLVDNPVESPIIKQTPATEGTPEYNLDADGNYTSLKQNDYGGASVKNPNFPRFINVNNLKESNIVKYAGQRYGNASNVRLEIRYGKDSSVFQLIGIQIDYIKAPQYIRLTQEQMDLTEDTSQIMEFPDYICQEIINELTNVIMENASDQRLQTHPAISQSIAAPAQAQDTNSKK